MFRGANAPTGAVVVRANWSDNPWLPEVLRQERTDCLRDSPDQHDHIWEGGYATVLAGAYYAAALSEARNSRPSRIGNVSRDPLLPIRAFWDIGVKDATASMERASLQRTLQTLAPLLQPVRALVRAGIPVFAQFGLTPQTAMRYGIP